jgi:hypothetical protein
MAEPRITIKKTDGTTVQLTLSQFRVYQETGELPQDTQKMSQPISSSQKQVNVMNVPASLSSGEDDESLPQSTIQKSESTESEESNTSEHISNFEDPTAMHLGAASKDTDDFLASIGMNEEPSVPPQNLPVLADHIPTLPAVETPHELMSMPEHDAMQLATEEEIHQGEERILPKTHQKIHQEDVVVHDHFDTSKEDSSEFLSTAQNVEGATSLQENTQQVIEEPQHSPYTNDGDALQKMEQAAKQFAADMQSYVPSSGETSASPEQPISDPTQEQAQKQTSDLPTDQPAYLEPLPAKSKEPISVEPASQKPTWDTDDHKSLLDEAAELSNAAASPQATIGEITQTVVQRLTFSIQAELMNRFSSLIESRKRNIRTDIQLYEYLVKDVQLGGMGWNDAQAKEAVDTVLDVLLRSHKEFERAYADLQAKNKLAKEMHLSSQGHVKVPVFSDDEIHPGLKKAIIPENAQRSAQNKPIMHDVAPTEKKKRVRHHKKKRIGPVDEIAAFTVLDFRRLAPTGQRAGEQLLHKFDTLRSDSYLLFMKARDAWHGSPLYQDYLDMITKSLMQKETVSELISSGQISNPLSMDEFLAIAELNKEIRF